ncbi:MAG: putative transport system permease protein, partial [Bryobacterales bacterium]|nr:putative transport system permease protein [Bryobacterales bacterium]
PELGRYYTEDEDQPGASPVTVIGDRLWKRRFKSDPNVLGKTLRMDGVETTIIGVMPPGFGLFDSEDPDFFIPFAFTNAQLQGRVHWITVAARLKPEVRTEGAQAKWKLSSRHSPEPIRTATKAGAYGWSQSARRRWGG